MNRSDETVSLNLRSSFEMLSNEHLKAITIFVECPWFTLSMMNVLFRALNIQVVAYEVMSWLMERGMLIKHQGIYDTYYNVTCEFRGQWLQLQIE